MTALQMLGLAGMIVAGGLALAVMALRPAPPQLAAALALLDANPTAAVAVSSTRDRWGWLPPGVAAFLDSHLGVSDTDLQIIGWTRSQLAARKVAVAVAGLLVPSVLVAMASLLGLSIPIVIPGAVCIALAVFMWMVPSREAREKAEAARAEFRSALASLLDLVALERRARGSVPEALEAASEVASSPPFQLINSRLTLAARAGISPWQALHDLGEELDVNELRNLADIASVAAEGAAVYQTLLAESRTLRHAELAAQHAAANVASEKLVYPLALLGIGFMLLVFVPAVLRLFAP